MRVLWETVERRGEVEEDEGHYFSMVKELACLGLLLVL